MDLTKLAKAFMQTAAAAAIAVSAAGTAKADVVGFYYNTDLVATLGITGNTNFSLSFIYAPASSGVAFMNDLLLEYPGSWGGNLTFLNLGGDTAPDATAQGCQSCSFEGTDANIKISWPVAGNGARFNEGEVSNFQITTTNPDRWDFSRLHINAFLNGDSIKLTGSECTSGTCVSKVPEPGSLALMSLALLGAGVGLRRRPK